MSDEQFEQIRYEADGQRDHPGPRAAERRRLTATVRGLGRGHDRKHGRPGSWCQWPISRRRATAPAIIVAIGPAG